MSSASEVVGQILEAWSRGDFRTSMNLLDPGFTLDTFMPDSNQRRVARGAGEVELFGREWFAQWRDYRIIPVELREAGRGVVFAAARQVARGRLSDALVDAEGYMVWTVEEERVVKLSLHYDRDEALAAAGLPR